MSELIPAFIINRNLLTWPKKIYYFFKQFDYIIPYIIDNNSNYEPLLDWYKTIENVIVMNENDGHLVGWRKNIINEITSKLNSEYYIYTDPDLDIWNLPYDFIYKLKNGFNLLPNISKVGVHIKTSDLLKNNPFLNSEDIENYENNLLEHPLQDNYFYSKIDTTLALYSIKNSQCFTYEAIRVTGNYMCRHLPFYFTGEKEQIVEGCTLNEWLYYCNNSNLSISNTALKFLNYYNDLIMNK